jgi:hypothetical protein
MYRFAPNFDLGFCVGSSLDQIAIGKYDVQFKFGSGATIAVQSQATVLCREEPVANWTESEGWSSLAYHRLLNEQVTKGIVIDERTIEIQFTENLALRIYDNSDQYESMQIYLPAPCSGIIVI